MADVQTKLEPAARAVPGPAPATVPTRPAPRPRRARWLLALVATAAAIGAGGWWWAAHRQAPVAYKLAALDRGPIARAVTASGTVNPVLTIVVGSYVSGVVQDISCDFNTAVRKGQVCARIDPRPYELTVEQSAAALQTAQAQLEKDRATLAYAEVNYQRLSSLLQLDSVSRDAVDVARSQRDQDSATVGLDQAAIRQRQAALEAAKVNLGYTRIVSPVDGVVVSRNVTIGQTVAASFQTPTLFLIAQDLTKMQVDTNVSESDVGGLGRPLQVGDPATFTVEAYPNRVFQGVVSQVRQAPQTVQNVVTYDVVVTVDNPRLLLRPGMTATVRIVTEERRDALRAPSQALRYRPGGLQGERRPGQGRREGGDTVWVLKDGKPAAVPVVTGLSDETRTEIASPALKAGEEVVISETGRAAARLPTPSTRF